MALNHTMVKMLSALHRFWYGLTDGRVGSRMNGMDVLLMTTKGRKSGNERTTPLQYMRDGDAYVVVASNGGSDRHPGWWLNLRSEPSATIRVRDARIAVRGEEASDDERARLWPLLASAYAGYDQYAKETTRRIPVVILRPRAGGESAPS